MRLLTEDEILKPEVRKKIIEEINSTENKARKEEHYKRHMILKDQIKYFVIEQLQKQFDSTTIREMEYALSNINIQKKIIDKLAKVYAHGVQRTITNEDGEKDDTATANTEKLESTLSINQAQKIANRYLKTHLNVAQYVKPCPHEGAYTIKLQSLAPYLYDVVEQYYDRTKPLVFILSPFDYKGMEYSSTQANREVKQVTPSIQKPQGDGKDQLIADNKDDENKEEKQIIWWSNKYHFTTDKEGNILTGESIANPIARLPFVNYAINQDNSFWAKGADDLADGTILVNALLTHLNHISVTQGYGQFYMKGKNLPRNVVIGPSKALIMEYEADDPVPDIGFANANPNLQGIMSIIETYVALMLTTNNLSTSGVSMQLTNGANFPSGVALMLDKSESMEDVQDQRQIFVDNEQALFEIINEWLKLFNQEGSLDPKLQSLILPDGFNLKLTFNQNQVLQTETEKLTNIEKRKDLGLNTAIELIKMDQPDLTDKEAEEKLKAIMKEKLIRTAEAMGEQQEPEDETMMEENEDSSYEIQQ